MADHPFRDDSDSDIEDPHRQWFISRCAHGDVHVGLGRVVVTMAEEEFDAFWGLMCRAREHFGRATMPDAPPATRPH